MSIGEKLPKLDEKTKRKTGSSIGEKLPKFDEETKKKTNYLVLFSR